MQIRIYYEDTDAGGIVYHSKYLNFCERARSEAFFQRGLNPFEDENSGFVVRKVEADFLSTAKLGDILEIDTAVLEKKRTNILLKQTIKRDEQIVFEAKILLAYIKDGKVARIPDSLMAVIEDISI